MQQFLGIIVILATILTLFGRARGRRQGMESVGWSTVSGRITESRFIEGNPHIGKQDSGAVSYTYKVADKEYRGTNVSLYDTPDILFEALKKYPVGKIVKVSYDPKRPTISAIEPGMPKLITFKDRFFIPSQILILLFGLAFGLYALGAE